VEATAYLMDRPRGGWDSLATKAELEVVESRLRADMAELRVDIAELRADIQEDLRDMSRWFAMAIIGSLSITIAAMAVIGAALRFA
jgi:hypothetical protein